MYSLARPAQKKKKEKDPDVQEKVIGFPDGKEGCELFVGEKASAYELREKGEATGEGKSAI